MLYFAIFGIFAAFKESMTLNLAHRSFKVIHSSKLIGPKYMTSFFDIWWNNVYRKAFKMHQLESVKELQWFCERLDFKNVVHKRKLLFEGAYKVTEYCFADMGHGMHCLTQSGGKLFS